MIARGSGGRRGRNDEVLLKRSDLSLYPERTGGIHAYLRSNERMTRVCPGDRPAAFPYCNLRMSHHSLPHSPTT